MSDRAFQQVLSLVAVWVVTVGVAVLWAPALILVGLIIAVAAACIDVEDTP